MLSVTFHQGMDLIVGIQKLADGVIMIQRINDQRSIFTHINTYIIWAGKQFRCLIDAVGRQNFGNDPLFIVSVKLSKAVGGQSGGNGHKNSISFVLNQNHGHMQHTYAGRDHIIDDKYVIAYHG